MRDGTSTRSDPAATAPEHRVAKNAALLLALRFGLPFFSLLLVLVLSRLLGPEDLGRYTLAFTVFFFFTTVAPLGLNALLTRDGARDPERLDVILGSALLIGACSSVVLTPIMAVTGYFLTDDFESRTAIALLALGILPSTALVFMEASFVALERVTFLVIESVIDNVVRVILALLALALGGGLIAIVAVSLVARVLACVVSFALLHRAGIRPRREHGTDGVAHLLKAAPTFLLITVFATIYWRIDVVMLSLLSDVRNVGLYSAAYRILELTMVLPQSFCLAVYPQMSASAVRNPESLADMGNATLRYLTAATLPIAVGISILGMPILNLLYGHEFVAAAATLSVSVWTVLPYTWVRYHAYALVALNHQRVDLLLNIAMSTLNVLLNLALIPVYGHLGAAIATLLSIIVYMIGQHTYLRTHLRGAMASHLPDVRLLVAVTVMAAVLAVVRSGPVILAGVVGAIVYGAVLWLLGFFAGGMEQLAALTGRAAGRAPQPVAPPCPATE